MELHHGRSPSTAQAVSAALSTDLNGQDQLISPQAARRRAPGSARSAREPPGPEQCLPAHLARHQGPPGLQEGWEAWAGHLVSPAQPGLLARPGAAAGWPAASPTTSWLM